MANQIHTTYSKHASNWRNITNGASRPAKVYPAKSKAVDAGRW
ncbi:MAG: DUF2188 domain-containing protein [Candidatus Nomurabacteria bacterium]|nr:DUF2188 domain-containing protein [Candidatus Nomurabacteria bacterium]